MSAPPRSGHVDLRLHGETLDDPAPPRARWRGRWDAAAMSSIVSMNSLVACSATAVPPRAEDVRTEIRPEAPPTEAETTTAVQMEEHRDSRDASATATAPKSPDVLAVSLTVDVSTRRMIADVTFAHPASIPLAELALEVGDLRVFDVRGAAPGSDVSDRDPSGATPGPDLAYRIDEGQIWVNPPLDARPTFPPFAGLSLEQDVGTRRVTFVVEPQVHDALEGLHTTGVTMSWPELCGELFPCNPEPTDGLRFQLRFTGVPDGQVVVAPEDIRFDAPSYMLAWAVGPYVELSLGETKHGTRVVAFVRPSVPGEERAMRRGTADLVGEFELLEDMLGPYPYGDKVGSVAAPWPSGAYGGMEHHPYWHVADTALDDGTVHAHEAAHGWFGNGIRVACWEDLVLSEGFATYLEGRAKESAAGPAEGAKVWAEIESRWEELGADGTAPRAWWPDSCEADDPIVAGFFSSAPYVRGGMFLRALERRLGRETFDTAVRSFVAANLGHARRLAHFLEHVRDTTGYDPHPCARDWLNASELPRGDRCEEAVPTPGPTSHPWPIPTPAPSPSPIANEQALRSPAR